MDKLTKAQAKRIHGSYYRVAKVAGVNRATVSRWGKIVPEKHMEILMNPVKRLEAAGWPRGMKAVTFRPLYSDKIRTIQVRDLTHDDVDKILAAHDGKCVRARS